LAQRAIDGVGGIARTEDLPLASLLRVALLGDVPKVFPRVAVLVARVAADEALAPAVVLRGRLNADVPLAAVDHVVPGGGEVVPEGPGARAQPAGQRLAVADVVPDAVARRVEPGVERRARRAA